MLFSLDETEVKSVLQQPFVAEFTNAEMLIALYRTDPSVVRRILPRPLRPPADPLVLAFVAHYPKTNFGCVYNEGAVVVLASYRGRLGGYCVAMPVDDDT